MKSYFAKIRENTAGMNGREKADYVLTYYWYHILGFAAALGLVLFLIIHFGFRQAPPVFTCVLVNQDINFARDQEPYRFPPQYFCLYFLLLLIQ